MQLTLVKRQPEARDSESFWFKPAGPLSYRAGQFMKWTLLVEQPDDRGASRFFTISSSPTEKLVSLTTKFALERPSSFKTALRQLQPGNGIEATNPSGSFTLPESLDRPLVFVAGGIGVTPFRSMLKYMHDTGTAHPIHLLYSCHTIADAPFRALLAQLTGAHDWLKLTYVVEQADSDWDGESGRLSADRIQALAGDLSDKLVYLSGPEPMIEALAAGLHQLGVPEDHIKTDFFPGYTKI